MEGALELATVGRKALTGARDGAADAEEGTAEEGTVWAEGADDAMDPERASRSTAMLAGGPMNTRPVLAE